MHIIFNFKIKEFGFIYGKIAFYTSYSDQNNISVDLKYTTEFIKTKEFLYQFQSMYNKQVLLIIILYISFEINTHIYFKYFYNANTTP